MTLNTLDHSKDDKEKYEAIVWHGRSGHSSHPAIRKMVNNNEYNTRSDEALQTEGLRGSVVANVERAIEVVGEGRLPTFCTVTGDGNAYFNKVQRDLPRLQL